MRDGESTTKSDVVRVHLAEESIEAMVPMEVGVTLPLETFTSHSLKLHRLVDQLYLRDMIDAGLVDAAWLTRLPAELAARLKELLDDPHG